jgi:glycine cleavage system H protein
VLEVNTAVVEEPSTVNDDPYGAGWLIRIALADAAEADALLEVAAYRELLATQ